MPDLIDTPKHGFVQDLDWKDFERLRKITLQIYRDQHPGKPDPHPLVIVGMINEFGPVVAETLLKRAVDNKLVL